MRLRRWVVHEYTALPEPDDTVRRVAGPFFYKYSAMKWLSNPSNGAYTLQDFRHIAAGHMGHEAKARLHMNPVWCGIMRLPQKRWLWRTRRFLRKHGWELR